MAKSKSNINRKSNDINDEKSFIPQQVAQCYFKIIIKHRGSYML